MLLRRGLNVIIGDVGTGKTTLCRQLIRNFARRDEITTHLILDPHFADALELLTTVGKMLMGNDVKLGSNEWQIKEQIKQHLFKSGVKQNKTTVLIIDEGQKIPAFCLEILREFLNYETNEFKLLQIIIFAQEEFENTIKKYANFADRINLYHYLKPLNFRDTQLMINFRLEKSKTTHKKLDFFSYPAMLKIYRASGGYPRKIINLCHHCILAMIVQNRKRINAALVRSCIKRAFPGEPRRWKGAVATAAVVLVAALAIFAFLMPDKLRALWPQKLAVVQNTASQKDISPAEGAKTAAAEATAQPGSSQAASREHSSEAIAETENNAIASDSQKTVAGRQAATEDSQIAALGPAMMPSGSAASDESTETSSQAAVSTTEQPALEQENSAEDRRPYAPILGNIRLKQNDTLSLVIQKVYGNFNSKYFRSLILANPVIDDPDLVAVDQTIHLPAIPVSVTTAGRKAWWILLEETDDLNVAFDFLRTYPENAPPARIIPYWNEQAGTRFAIVLKRYFTDPDSALAKLSQVPPELAPEGKVLSSWQKDTVFFANPFARPSQQSSVRAQED